MAIVSGFKAELYCCVVLKLWTLLKFVIFCLKEMCCGLLQQCSVDTNSKLIKNLDHIELFMDMDYGLVYGTMCNNQVHKTVYMHSQHLQLSCYRE